MTSIGETKSLCAAWFLGGCALVVEQTSVWCRPGRCGAVRTTVPNRHSVGEKVIILKWGPGDGGGLCRRRSFLLLSGAGQCRRIAGLLQYIRGVQYCLRAVPADATKALEVTGGGQPRHVGDEHCMMKGGPGNINCITLRSFLH